jgi:hypothetical protein
MIDQADGANRSIRHARSPRHYRVAYNEEFRLRLFDSSVATKPSIHLRRFCARRQTPIARQDTDHYFVLGH